MSTHAHGRVGAGKDAQDAQVAADRTAAAGVQASMRPGETSGWIPLNSYTVGTNPYDFGDRTPAAAVFGAITANPFTGAISGGTATPRGGSNMFVKPVNMWDNEGSVDTLLHNRFTLGDGDREWSRNMPKASLDTSQGARPNGFTTTAKSSRVTASASELRASLMLDGVIPRECLPS